MGSLKLNKPHNFIKLWARRSRRRRKILETFIYSVALASSGFNLGYFATYTSPRRGRQLGARALALVSLGTFAQSLLWLLGSWSRLTLASTVSVGNPEPLAKAVVALGSLVMSLLILRAKVANRGDS